MGRKKFGAVIAVTCLLMMPLSAVAGPLDVFRDCDACPEMVELPLGEFVMGAREDEFLRNYVFHNGKYQPATAEIPYIAHAELPRHRVVVDIPIAIGRNEVTYAEWMACVADGGCNGYVPSNEIGRSGTREAIMNSLGNDAFPRTPSEADMLRAMIAYEFLKIGGRYPVFYVSSLDAQAYVSWLNSKVPGNPYRLPTEAEWEYAARAGTTTRYAQGEEILPGQANFSGEVTEDDLLEKRPDLRTLGFPVPVDELDAANPWGLRHMSGNADEITASCYSERYEGWSTTSEWLAHATAGHCKPSVRGGAYTFGLNNLRVAYRRWTEADSRNKFTGFRVAKQLTEN